jgi:putative tryptophan/tyrosine transport system substrate-binding protein
MDRRDFVAGTTALLVSPRRSWAQGPPRRIGYLDIAPLYLPNYKVWQDSMRDHGWIEGKNLIVDYRSAEGHAERVVPLANELVALKPDVLVGPSPQEALALKSATASIPIIFAAVADPARLGLVQSLSHPGGNITGLTTFVPGNFMSKGIEILREMVPAASKIAVLVNPGACRPQLPSRSHRIKRIKRTHRSC